MKKLYFFLLSFLSLVATAQNYRAYVPSRPAYYYSDTSWAFYSVQSMKGIAEDTAWYNGSHRIVASYRENIAENYQNNVQCFLLDTTWVGYQIEQDTTTGETWFFNTQGDTVRFFPGAGIGQTGMLCRFSNGNAMRALVTSVVSGQVMTLTDSIRILSMQLENPSGNPLPHVMNGKEIHLSKQYGLLQTYEWSDFPDDTTKYVLAGMENPVVGHRIITAAEIYDYNIGDRFDWSVKSQSANPSPGPLVAHYYSWTITNKTVNGNFVTYDVTQDYAHKIGTQVLQQTWGTTFSVTYDFALEDTSWLLLERPFDIMNGPDTSMWGGNSFTYATMPYSPARFNGRVMKGHRWGPPYGYDTTTHCFNGLTVSFGPCDGWQTVWAEGLGKVYSYQGSVSCWTIYELEYYEKGSEIWGTPHNWSVILDVNSSPENTIVNAYPNPASEMITVEIPEAGSANYSIYSVTGQLVSTGTSVIGNGIVQIPVAELSEGSYSVVIECNGQQYRTQFVK